MRYLKLWFTYAKVRLLVNLQERWAAGFFIVGKFIRFIFVGLFIITLSNQIGTISGYGLKELVIVYLAFNFLDLTSQFVFRGLYLFRATILYGGFDRQLLFPVNSLFSSLMTHIDFLDVPLWLVTSIALVFSISGYSALQQLMFLLFLINGLIIVAGFHILVAGCVIVFTVGDQMIHIFRDMSATARFPIDIYARPVRWLFNTLLPVAIAFTLPAKVLFGEVSIQMQLYGLVLGIGFLIVSLQFWKFALSRYSSASS